MSNNTIISLKPENVIRQLPWRVTSKSALGLVLIFTILSLVGWLYLTQASAVTTTSYQIDEQRLELEHVKNQNAALILEIAQLQTLARIEKRALELGYQPATEVKYLTVENYPLPEKSAAPDSAVPVENSVDAYVNDVEQPGWLVEKLDSLAGWVANK